MDTRPWSLLSIASMVIFARLAAVEPSQNSQGWTTLFKKMQEIIQQLRELNDNLETSHNKAAQLGTKLTNQNLQKKADPTIENSKELSSLSASSEQNAQSWAELCVRMRALIQKTQELNGSLVETYKEAQALTTHFTKVAVARNAASLASAFREGAHKN